MLTLAVLTLLAPVGCRRFNRRCDPPRDTTLPADRDTDPGVIPPRGTIPSPDVPVRPDPNRTTFSPVRPGPKLQDPVEPFNPAPAADLPRPFESDSRKLTDPAPPKPAPAPSDSVKPKKVLVPEKMPDTPEKAGETPDPSKYPMKDEGGKPVPDKSVFPDPVAPGGPFDLPKGERSGPTVVEEREPARRESKASPQPDTPPVGLSNFQLVKGKGGVAAGLKPTPDGYEWLAKSGYKSVVFANAPAADVAPVKAVCEAAGLKFVGIPTGPETMTAATAAFDEAVSAKDGPVYVCDDTGLRAGTLWYAHFRRVDLSSPDTAKVRAGGLGLGDTDTNPEQKKLWDAVQAVLK
jgi:protein tyrosine phosphatase (PTP) superfamily phosphohydrolase (DUF442 family)